MHGGIYSTEHVFARIGAFIRIRSFHPAFFKKKIDVISQKSQKTMWRETLLMLNLPEKLYIEQDYYENMLGFTTVELFLTTNIILLKGSK